MSVSGTAPGTTMGAMDVLFRSVPVKRHVGSVIGQLDRMSNYTRKSSQSPTEEIASPVIIVVITIVSTVIPFICIIVAIVLARWLWVKYRGGGVSEASGLVDREDTAQSSIKSREGSRKSTRSSRITKGDPNSRDHLIPEDGLTSPVEEALDENGISTVQATALQDDKASEAFVRRASTRRKSMSSVRVDGDTLMPITEAVRHMEAGRRSSMRIDSDQSRYLQEHGKNTLQTEAEIEPVAAHRDEVAIAIEPTSYDHLESRGRITLGEEDAMAASTSSAHSHHSHHTHETSHSHQEQNKVASKEETETQEKTPEVKEGDIDALEGQKEHLVEALDSKEDENAKTGLSTSDLSLNSEGGDGDESNPSYSYGNQVRQPIKET